jgi:two-component system sensor histidine kinase ChvG
VKVNASAEILETIFENIIDNAGSFSPSDGRILVTLIAHDGIAETLVEDEGPGVDPDRLGQLFERYQPVRPFSPDVTEQPGHLGIGLWIVRRNVQALDGQVFPENRGAGGLRVIVRLPLAERETVR